MLEFIVGIGAAIGLILVLCLVVFIIYLAFNLFDFLKEKFKCLDFVGKVFNKVFTWSLYALYITFIMYVIYGLGESILEIWN